MMAVIEKQPAAGGGGDPKPEIRNPKADGGVVADVAGNPKEESSMTTMEEKRTALPFEQQPRESQRAFAAFRAYLELGPERSLAGVAKQVGKGKRQMEKWSRRWSWGERITAYGSHMAELERRAIEDQAVAQGVEWAKMTEPVRREAWLEAERAIAMVRRARERWEKSGRTPGFEGMARLLELAFKLKQFAAGMPSEIKEVNTNFTATIDVDWEIALRKAYPMVATPPVAEPAVVDVEVVEKSEEKV